MPSHTLFGMPGVTILAKSAVLAASLTGEGERACALSCSNVFLESNLRRQLWLAQSLLCAAFVCGGFPIPRRIDPSEGLMKGETTDGGKTIGL
ncbi:MAG: hypothetical protein KatS3mg105_0972 [Gemmatales bacterium]|nr:MAG: hypothetical protein KatS3mg105_0972 [Gemmatales bacterium]